MVERLTDLLLQEATTIGLRWRLDSQLKARGKMMRKGMDSGSRNAGMKA
jgi:hypothetical protein